MKKKSLHNVLFFEVFPPFSIIFSARFSRAPAKQKYQCKTLHVNDYIIINILYVRSNNNFSFNFFKLDFSKINKTHISNINYVTAVQ